MLFLVSTPLRMLLFDALSGRTKVLRARDGEYFGISWNSSQLVMSHSAIDNASLQTWKDYRNAELGQLRFFDTKGLARTTQKCLLQPHQIECVDDIVLVANSGRNSISVFKSDGSLVRHAFLTGLKWDMNEDGRKGDHFNSIHKVGDRVWVVAHNHDKPSAVWELLWPDLETVSVRETSTGCAHNIWVGDLGIVICDSKNGSLYEVNSRETIWKAQEQPIFTRGLVITDDYIFVGRSEISTRVRRRTNNGGLWVVDRQTLRTIDRFIFPGSDVVHELRLIDAPDYAHVTHDFDLDWLDSIKNVSDSAKVPSIGEEQPAHG